VTSTEPKPAIAFAAAPDVTSTPAPGRRAAVAAWMLRRAGWRVVLAQPVPLRCVVVFYPHTSNWDFPIGLLADWAVGIHFRWVGKDTLFRGPWRGMFERWGGIPVNRRVSTGFIDQLAELMAREQDCRLVIAPEGTRSRTDHWRSGFYHLARAANVPVGLAFIDYPTRRVGVGGFVELTGDAPADLARIAAMYAAATGRRPELQGPVRLKDTPR
jgi:1-acyl-sn-glycerol-3-phosphate acyltransferase